MKNKLLDTVTKYKFWVLLLLVVGVHFTAFIPWYKLPHPDLFFVMHVIDTIWRPELFGDSWLTDFLMSFHTRTAPLYYYALAYPLRFVLSPKWVILSMGFFLTLGTAYCAGYPWTHWKHALLATFLVLVVLTVNVSPLEGNKRSFTTFFVVAALVSGIRRKYLLYLLLTGLAAGVYAPAGLILIAYYSLGAVSEYWWEKTSLNRSLLEVAGLCGIFLAVLTPYWSRVFLGEGRTYVTSFVDATAYSLTSLDGLVTTFLLGSRGTHYGALFMSQEHLDFFVIVFLLCGIQYALLRSDFEFPNRCVRMILAVLGLWVLAHLLFPLIYFPFKYTRLALPLALTVPAVLNLPASVNRLRAILRERSLARVGLYVTGGLSLVCLMLHKAGIMVLRLSPLTDPLGFGTWTFILLLPALAGLSVAFPNRRNQSHVFALLIVLLVTGLVFFPRENPINVYRGAHLSRFEGLLTVLQSSPPGSRIAGPPDLMVPMIGFGKRAVFNSTDWRTNDVLCRRNEAYWKVLFATDPSKIRTFMEKNDLRFFLVDRRSLNRENYFGAKGCFQQFGSIDTSDPYLNRRFKDLEWRSRKGRFYVLTPENLPRDTKD